MRHYHKFSDLDDKALQVRPFAPYQSACLQSASISNTQRWQHQKTIFLLEEKSDLAEIASDKAQSGKLRRTSARQARACQTLTRKQS
jgi:hypothetical protein